MNKEYIKRTILKKNKKDFLWIMNWILILQKIQKIFMESIIISNMEYDFHIYPDVNKLFNKPNEITKEISNEEMDIEK